MANAFASPQHRCLVFAQHRATLDLVQSQVLKPFFPHVRYERLDGSVPPQQRAAVVQRFNEQPPLTRHADSSACACGPDVRLLLLTTRSCGLGLNLVGADTVIFLEHDWNPFADLQAMDRAHRIGQTQPVTVYRLL
ncbi:P-loop containing nucleoside triphosphate hydrolase protein, partial [Ochromonadaceae sp. CCMP2298]